MRSNVTVGNGAEAERETKFGESIPFGRIFEFIIPSALGIDPESSIDAAAAVVDAIAMAAGGSGWLWFPS